MKNVKIAEEKLKKSMEEEKVFKINLDEDIEEKKEIDKFNEMELDVNKDDADPDNPQHATKKKKNPHRKRKA